MRHLIRQTKILPPIYFSDSWYFEPDKTDLKPRPEVWGGLLVALFALVVYVAVVRRDNWLGEWQSLATSLAGWDSPAVNACKPFMLGTLRCLPQVHYRAIKSLATSIGGT